MFEFQTKNEPKVTMLFPLVFMHQWNLFLRHVPDTDIVETQFDRRNQAVFCLFIAVRSSHRFFIENLYRDHHFVQVPVQGSLHDHLVNNSLVRNLEALAQIRELVFDLVGVHCLADDLVVEAIVEDLCKHMRS